MYYKPTKFNQNRWSHFWGNKKFLIFFSCELPLVLGVGKNKKKKAGDIYKRPLYIEFERDRSIGLSSMIGDGRTDRQTHTHRHFFLVPWIFTGKAESVILFGFECTINAQNLIKIIGATFEKIKFLKFFSCQLSLILGEEGKLKKNGWKYLQEDPRYRIWTRSVNWFSLYDRRRTDRLTDTYTFFFLKHSFRLWEWCRIKYHKKIEVENFDDCNTSFTPNVARK